MPEPPDSERPAERRTPARPHLLLVERVWPRREALSRSERSRRWHIARIDRERDPLARDGAASNCLAAVLRRRPPEDVAPFADEHVDNVLDLIDTVEVPDPDPGDLERDDQERDDVDGEDR